MIVVVLALGFCMFVCAQLSRAKREAQRRQRYDVEARVRLLREVRRYDNRL